MQGGGGGGAAAAGLFFFVGCLVGLLVGCLVGLLVGFLVGFLVGCRFVGFCVGPPAQISQALGQKSLIYATFRLHSPIDAQSSQLMFRSRQDGSESFLVGFLEGIAVSSPSSHILQALGQKPLMYAIF